LNFPKTSLHFVTVTFSTVNSDVTADLNSVPSCARICGIYWRCSHGHTPSHSL